MVKAIEQPAKFSYVLLKFQYGDENSPDYIAYTDWTSQVPGNPNFTSKPELEINIPENTAVLDEKVLVVALPTDSWVSDVASGIIYSPVFVEASELIFAPDGGPAATHRKFFRGRLLKTIKNYQGKENWATFQFATAKSRLQVPLGISANPHCAWTLFGGGCKALESSHFVQLYVDTLDGKELTVTTNPGKTGAYFHRGYAVRNGIRVPIQYWHNSVPKVFWMVRQPPAEWVGNQIKIVAGCDKTKTTCNGRFTQLDNFAGIGYAIPNYNVIIEEPAQ